MIALAAIDGVASEAGSVTEFDVLGRPFGHVVTDHDLQAMGERLREGATARAADDVRRDGPHDIVLEGSRGFMFEVEAEVGGVAIHQRIYALTVNDYLYDLSIQCATADEARYRPELERMFASIRFDGKASAPSGSRSSERDA